MKDVRDDMKQVAQRILDSSDYSDPVKSLAKQVIEAADDLSLTLSDLKVLIKQLQECV